jgi:ligand-binding sensor domain-containing protein
MWFGTWSGLCRYDGYTIRIYRYDPENPRSIINNRIHNILRDSVGDLWISTFDDKYYCRYNYNTDDFERVPNDDLPKQLEDKINRREHKLHVNYSYRQNRWHLAEHTTALVETHLPSGRQKVYAVDPSNPWAINDAYVSDIYLDEEHVLWLGTYSNGINRAYIEATPFHNMYHDPNASNTIIENTVKSICEDRQGDLWIGTRSKGITVVDKKGRYRHFQTNSARQPSIQSDYIKKIFCDSKGVVWIGNQRGLDRYDPKTETIQPIKHPALNNISVFGIAEDDKTNIWLA